MRAELKPLAAGDLDRLVSGRHATPHDVLGVHDGAVRIWRPDATTVSIVLDSGQVVRAERMHNAGLFQAPLRDVEPYRVLLVFPDGSEFETQDPYRFWPTLGDLDLHLIGEGRHRELWKVLGAHHREHQGVWGTSFSVWAPDAEAVRVVGDWNGWDGRVHPMRSLGVSGIWELFLPGLSPGERYKFEVAAKSGALLLKADPMARATESPPENASVVAAHSQFVWSDDEFIARRDSAPSPPLDRPMSIYEVHLPSWRRLILDADQQVELNAHDRSLTYLELAEQLPAYASELGFTHVEFMPCAHHPLDKSWGYQVTGYYAIDPRFGSADEFRALVDACHDAGLGVYVDWVPAHFPKDDWALGRFDGTALYEHADPRMGSHPDWGTFIFNFGRTEVRNFLIANALWWLDEMHIDGLRVDAVASMLYLDYSREGGDWLPNEYGGRENLDALSFLRELNTVVHELHPGVAMIAEESTAWGGVSRPVDVGGLGFGFKWNMGWMHDTLRYMSKEPVHRKFHHHDVTFGLLYAWHENFVLPLSHDEVVHGKGSLLSRMPGDRWQQFANLRAMYAWMWAHPGKKLLFMGGEIGQNDEWDYDSSIDWHLAQWNEHGGVQRLVRQLNHAYDARRALWERDFDQAGFAWIESGDADANTLAFSRHAPSTGEHLVCVANFSPVVRYDYRVGVAVSGSWLEVLNTDADAFGGSGVGNLGRVEADEIGAHGRPYSLQLTLPPLSVLWLEPHA